VRDDFTHREREPAERGRLTSEDRPGAALPMNARRLESYASPHARATWYEGILTCGEIDLEPPDGIAPDATLLAAARKLAGAQSSFLPVWQEERPRGALYVEDLLNAIADGRDAARTRVAEVASTLVPTVGRQTLLVDAVRLMIGAFLRRIPVLADDERIGGFVTLAEAAALADRDPAVRDALGQMALSPSLWARRFR
jgi:CBS domain-containing protein